MDKILGFIGRYFWIFFLVAIAVGVFAPTFSGLVNPYMDVLMIVIMYLWCLKVTAKDLQGISKNWKKVLGYLLVSMFVLPVGFYFVTDLIYPAWSIGIFLLVAAPAGIASIALSGIVKGNTSLVATITILSSIICVFSIPLLADVLFWSEVNIDVLAIFLSLVKRVILPCIAAQLTQRIYPWYVRFKSRLGPLTVLLVMPIIRWPIGANMETYKSLDWKVLVYGTLGLFAVSIMLHVIWWVMYRNGSHADKIAWSIGMWYMNLTLSLLLAGTYFGPHAVLVVLLFELPWDFMLIPFAWISKRLK